MDNGKTFRAVRREQVLVAAAEVFTSVGFHEASMEEIAARVGVSKPVLYKSCAGKLELYLAVLHEATGNFLGALTDALQGAEGVRPTVHATVGAFFDFADDHGGNAALIAGANVTDEPAAQRTVRVMGTDCVERVFDALVRDSAVEVRRARLLAAGLVGAAQACAGRWRIAGRPIPKNDAVAATVQLCWHGLAGIQLEATSPSPPPRG